MPLKSLLQLGAFLLLCTNLYANQQIIQDVLDGSNIPKFVESLTTFSGKRVHGSDLSVISTEFQQKILPSSFYKNLPSRVKYRSADHITRH